MRYLILLAVISCISSSSAQVHFPGGCPALDVVANFATERYFGLWYYQENYPYVYQLNGRCLTVTYSTSSATRLRVDNRLTDSNTGENRVKSGTGRIISSAKFGLSFDGISAEEPRWVLATDYDNYTILYSCVDFSGFLHTKTVWIMTREQMPSATTMAIALAKLDSLGISRQFLVHVDQTRCDLLLREAVPERVPIW